MLDSVEYFSCILDWFPFLKLDAHDKFNFLYKTRNLLGNCPMGGCISEGISRLFLHWLGHRSIDFLYCLMGSLSFFIASLWNKRERCQECEILLMLFPSSEDVRLERILESNLFCLPRGPSLFTAKDYLFFLHYVYPNELSDLECVRWTEALVFSWEIWPFNVVEISVIYLLQSYLLSMTMTELVFNAHIVFKVAWENLVPWCNKMYMYRNFYMYICIFPVKHWFCLLQADCWWFYLYSSSSLFLELLMVFIYLSSFILQQAFILYM